MGTKNPFCWEEAERLVAERIKSALGSDWNRHAYLGYLPPIMGAWAFISGDQPDVRNTWDESGNAPTELRMKFLVTGRWKSRADCQQFGMRVALSFPITDEHPIRLARLDAPGIQAPVLRRIRLANHDDESAVWHQDVSGELVFYTEIETG